MSNIPAGQQWFGYPAMPGRDYLRVFASARAKREVTARVRCYA